MKTHPSLPLLPTISSILSLIKRTAKKSIAIWALLIALPYAVFIATAYAAHPEFSFTSDVRDTATWLYGLFLILLSLWAFLGAIHHADSAFKNEPMALRVALDAAKRNFISFLGFIGGLVWIVFTARAITFSALEVSYSFAAFFDMALLDTVTDSMIYVILGIFFSLFVSRWILAPAAMVIEKLHTGKSIARSSAMVKHRFVSMVGFTSIVFMVGLILFASFRDWDYWEVTKRAIDLPSYYEMPALIGAIKCLPGVIVALWLIVVLPPMLVVIFHTLRDLEAAKKPEESEIVASSSEDMTTGFINL